MGCLQVYLSAVGNLEHMMRRWWMAGLGLLAACSSGQDGNAAGDASLPRTFFGAMFDEMRGPPGADALAEHVRFSQAGIHFDYPKPLRLSVDRDHYTTWALERGDFELELHVPDSDIHAEDYLDGLVEILANKDHPVEGPLQGRTVRWCGQETTGRLYRFEFLGDPRIYEGFELPATRAGTRFLIFDDIPRNGDWTDTGKATFASVDASIECDGGKIPVRASDG